MKPRIRVITLGVDDLERSLAFYRSLGLQSAGVIAEEFAGDEENAAGAIAMFELHGGLFLCIFPKGELAKDARIPARPPYPACSASVTRSAVGRRSTPFWTRRRRPAPP